MKSFPFRDPSWVNDVHSALNQTRVAGVFSPQTVDDLVEGMQLAVREELPLSTAGCRHAMGGQQFAKEGVVLDTRSLDKVISFDREAGLLRAQGGIQWPALISSYLAVQTGEKHPWGIAQKQTGADTFTLGGSLAANAHGRGLTLRPIIQDVEAFTLVKASGEIVTCSRDENPDLFALAIGGYGLFGIIVDATLRLIPRRKVERVVELADREDLAEKFSQRIADGFLYGDFQFSIDEASPDFLRKGVFACYRPTDRPVPADQGRKLDADTWLELLHLAYTDRARGFERYTSYYLSTNGQVYWSDTHQLSPYLPDYAQRVQKLNGTASPSTLMITELYVPRADLAAFLAEAARELQERGVVVIYGTFRLIEKDTESFLAWARDSYGCIIFNLLIEQTSSGQERAEEAFRMLIDLAATKGGSYYLTYHRFAPVSQVQKCYPQFDRFLALKKQHDPDDVFQSDWYRHYRDLFKR